MEAMKAVSPDWIAARIRELGPWFHNIELAGLPTAPDHFLGDYPRFKWRQFQHVLPESLAGMSVLDIGCNAGFYSCEMKRRGAERVVAIDSDPRYLRQAELVAAVSGLEIDFRELSVYDIAALGERFDLVIFMGVLYHLRHPLLALDLIYEHVAKDYLLYQSMERGSRAIADVAANYPFEETAVFAAEGYPALYFIEHRYADDPTNWWVPNHACSEAMLRSAGFAIEARPDDEVYLCRRGQRHKHTPPPPAVWGAEQSPQRLS
jgi:tRNA (mo5U34)-methyltransferase